MFLVELISQKPTDIHQPMVFDNFGTLQQSVRTTWSRSNFEGEIIPQKNGTWKIVERPRRGLGISRFIATVSKISAVPVGPSGSKLFVHTRATHL